MSRLIHLALASALVFTAAPALAHDPENVGQDYTPAPAISLGAPGDRAAPSEFAWDPEIIGLDASVHAVGYVSLDPVADPIALIDPGPGSTSAYVASSTASAAATFAAGAGAVGANEQLACSCPCK